MGAVRCKGIPSYGFLVFCTLLASNAGADVVDVGADGAVMVHNLPGVYVMDPDPAYPKSNYPSASLPSHAVDRLLDAAAKKYAIDPSLLHSVAWTESRKNEGAISSKGAVGVMQLMDGTARDLGVDRFNISQNIFGGALYLKQMLLRYSGQVPLALAAYNAGPALVDRYRDIPPFPATQRYVQAVLGSPKPAIHFPQPFVILIDPERTAHAY